ncbi:hypothetical protein ACFQH6_03500 [Halobacteriaceae archaeon GCM10025711]
MDENTKRFINPRILYRQAINFERLINHLEKSSVSVEKTVNLLEDLAVLKEIHGFEPIGIQIAETRDQLLEENTMKTAWGLAKTQVSDGDHDRLYRLSERWKTRFQDTVNEKVFTTTAFTDIPPAKLSKGAEAFFSIEIGEEFSDEVRDLNEACTNLLCANHTSAEFMALRGTEGVIRKWFDHETDEDIEYKDWYGAIDRMTSDETVPPRKDLKLLDYLRDRRNEVAHPDRHSTKRDAENTLRNAFEVTESLIRDIQEPE